MSPNAAVRQTGNDQRETERNTARRGSHLQIVQAPAKKPGRLPADYYNPRAVNPHQRVRSKYRCTLTGEPIQQGSALYVVRAQVKVTGYRYLDPTPDVVAPPLSLNVHPFHGGTEGVGLAFSGLMLRYLSAVLHELDTRNWHELSDWWESEYGISRVRRGLGEMYATEKADRILAWVLQCARGETTPADVARDYNHTVTYIAKTIARCQWLADKRAGTTLNGRPLAA